MCNVNSMLSENGTATGCSATEPLEPLDFMDDDELGISPSLLTTSRVHCRAVPVAGSTAETINCNCKIIGTNSINADPCYTEVLCHWEHAACC